MKRSLTVASLLSGLFPALVIAADTVFLSSHIYTGNPELPVARSMAVEGDTIVCVAENRSCAGGAHVSAATDIVDNGDATIMAGFVDTHLHTRLFGQTHATMLNLFAYNDRPTEEIEQAIRDWAAKLGPDEWVIGGGFSYANFPEPSRQHLDELVGGRPALISDNTQHNGWYSTRALEFFGVDENWPVPKGGYMPLDESGKPTGHLREKAHLSLGFVEQHKLYSHEKQEESVAAAARLLNAAGVTSALEAAGGSREGSDDVYVRMAKKGTLKLRHNLTMVFWGGAGDPETDQAMIDELVARRAAVHEAMESDQHPFLMANTVKFAIDGTPGAYAYMELPYLDGTRPQMNYTPDNLNWIFNELTERGFRLMLHVEGDAAMRKSLDALDYADQTGEPLDSNARHVFTHIDHASTSLVGRMKQRGVMAQLQYHWGDPADEYFQTVVKENVPTFLLQHGFNNHGMVVQSDIDYGAGPDAPTSPIYKPFDGIEIALTRQSLGQPDSERMPGDALTLDQALYGYTLGSARLMHREGQIGSLEKGKLADIIVLDRNIARQTDENVYEIHSTEVVRTYLGGELVHAR